ncbi:hypothetical protein BDN70DRAFT_846753 [Pholiota conissans]|uniref:BHLH domain-containing protein n=1 Tax=Pholiota conissans TaxID=109636 RepID=A0A9P6D0E4_9AGAR|nr:hypothetical protein BDN70DRAFT_846753 [Pholiota conissans]
MSTELGLDPSDPLNLILANGDSSSDESSQNENIQDWSKFSTLWADISDPTKHYADMMDFADLSTLPMDMDFNQSMSIEPSALHYDPMKLNFSYDDQFSALSSELLASQFPFTFQSSISGSDFSSGSSSDSSIKERRLSVTSSSSSSGASLSPVPESVPSPNTGYNTDTQVKEEPLHDPAAELAQRVRQSAGVMLAVPMNAQLQGMGLHAPAGADGQAKIPIPRLPRQNPTSSFQSSSASTSSSAASTPPPLTPPTAINSFKMTVNTNTGFAGAEAVPTPSAPVAGQGRPKTSHTTIERRYRTNLNARIQSLRMAVPALRVLEDREGGNGKKIKKNVKGSVLIKSSGSPNPDIDDGSVDVIDERGFVDGVKVARKCSKANVLGKAVEYIRVLKKREQRLKAEQAGLKTLISGLVGGPALVREWEKEWRASFGGEERDEVEGEDEEADDDDSDDDDGDDDEEGRKRKRSKIASATAPKKPVQEKKKPAPPSMLVSSDAGGIGVPEKRKRGRPRKVVVPPAAAAASSPSEGSVQDEPMSTSVSTPFTATQAQWPQQQTQPQQYMLAVFALFSFFNSPLTSSSLFQSGHHHTGAVLSVQPPLAYAPEIISQFTAPESVAAAGWPWKEYMQVFHLVVSVLVLASFASSWFGIQFDMGFGKAVAQFSAAHQVNAAGEKRESSFGSWKELAQDAVLKGTPSTLSLYERVQLYRSTSSRKNASVSDLATTAIVLQATPGGLSGVAHMKARSVWAAAKYQSEKAHTNTSEELVFDTLNVEDAAGHLAKATATDRTDGERAYTPIEVLACLVVKERVKKHVGTLFVDAVAEETRISTRQKDDEEWRKTIDAARELGGDVEELGRMLERVWKADAAVEDVDHVLEVTTEDAPGLDTDIRALFAALLLYRRLFAEAHDGSLSSSTLLSPPPTPTAKATILRSQMLRSLRTVLGGRVFEDDDLVEMVKVDEEDEETREMGLEDARDRVVDMIFDSERRLRTTSPS